MLVKSIFFIKKSNWTKKNLLKKNDFDFFTKSSMFIICLNEANTALDSVAWLNRYLIRKSFLCLFINLLKSLLHDWLTAVYWIFIYIGNEGRRFEIKSASYSFTAPTPTPPTLTTVTDINKNIIQYVGMLSSYCVVQI